MGLARELAHAFVFLLGKVLDEAQKQSRVRPTSWDSNLPFLLFLGIFDGRAFRNQLVEVKRELGMRSWCPAFENRESWGSLFVLSADENQSWASPQQERDPFHKIPP